MGVNNLEFAVDRPSIAAVQKAVEDFLRQSLPDVRKVNVVKVVPVDPEEGTWEAEADVWQPNATIESLQLTTERPVLDRALYLLRLDRQLDVQAYGLKDSVTTQE